MQEIKNNVIELLKSYPLKIRQMEQLKFELKHHTVVEEAEIIESLSFGSRTLDREGIHKTNHISDKTMLTALQYQDKVEQANNETVIAIGRELRSLETEVERLHHYISLLDEIQAEIIELYYFENMTLRNMEKELHMSRCALVHHRDEAVNALATMYSYVYEIKEKK